MLTWHCLDDLLHQMAWTDADLLREVQNAVRADAAAIPRNPAWGADYDPLTILANPGSEPEHELIALVNLRIAMHPDEEWGKCANCGFTYRHGNDTVCSDECWKAFAHHLAAETGTPLSRFGLEEEPRDISFHGSRDGIAVSAAAHYDTYGGDRIEDNPYGRDLY